MPKEINLKMIRDVTPEEAIEVLRGECDINIILPNDEELKLQDLKAYQKIVQNILDDIPRNNIIDYKKDTPIAKEIENEFAEKIINMRYAIKIINYCLRNGIYDYM